MLASFKLSVDFNAVSWEGQPKLLDIADWNLKFILNDMILYIRQMIQSLHQRSEKRKVLSVSRKKCHESALLSSN
jgi:hypothetical protein